VGPPGGLLTEDRTRGLMPNRPHLSLGVGRCHRQTGVSPLLHLTLGRNWRAGVGASKCSRMRQKPSYRARVPRGEAAVSSGILARIRHLTRRERVLPARFAGVEPSPSKWRSGSRPRVTQGWCSPRPRHYELRRRPRQESGPGMQIRQLTPISGKREWEAAARQSA